VGVGGIERGHDADLDVGGATGRWPWSGGSPSCLNPNRTPETLC